MKRTIGEIIADEAMELSTKIQGVGVLLSGYRPDGYPSHEKLQSVGYVLEGYARDMLRLHTLFDRLDWLKDSAKASEEVEYCRGSDDPLSIALAALKKSGR